MPPGMSAACKALVLAAAIYLYTGLVMGGPTDAVSFIVFVCATVSSIAAWWSPAPP